MKIFAAIALAAGMSALTAAHAQGADAVAQAQAAATRWVALADAGDYAASWDQAATSFQAAIAKPTWSEALQAVRAPLGAVKSRQLRSADFKRALPGAPDGEFVVVQFQTAFENKAAAVETVTPMKDKDGTWRVSGYIIK
jgi:DNA-binding GntR family transcriptional regulator